MTITRVRNGGRYVFWLGVLAVLWFALAPLQLGGHDSYVVTEGISMLPRIHSGDLVVTRKDANYRVGEVVAYHNPELGGAVVLHRIIKISNGSYTFKGDNNAYPDLFPVTKSKLVGREWIYLPRGGHVLKNLRVPYVGAAIIGVLTLFAFAGDFKRPSTRRRRRHHAT